MSLYCGPQVVSHGWADPVITSVVNQFVVKGKKPWVRIFIFCLQFWEKIYTMTLKSLMDYLKRLKELGFTGKVTIIFNSGGCREIKEEKHIRIK